MVDFEDHIYDRFTRDIVSWDPAAVGGVYALSFYIYDDEDDPRRPQVHLSYNTEARWRSQIARASTSDEAKWNFAFWLHDFKVIVGNSYPLGGLAPDYEGIALRERWLNSLDLNYRDEVQFTKDSMAKASAITAAFVQLCVRVAVRLHESGRIASKFGRSIPILIHELEYYDEIAYQTRAANPSGICTEFEEWVLSS
jgi:hypothetical protein